MDSFRKVVCELKIKLSKLEMLTFTQARTLSLSLNHSSYFLITVVWIYF